MNTVMAKIHPELPDKFKNLPNTSNLNKVEFREILGLTNEKFERLYLQNHIPKATYVCTLSTRYKTKKYFWNMGVIRSYIKDFEKWVSGEITSVI